MRSGGNTRSPGSLLGTYGGNKISNGRGLMAADLQADQLELNSDSFVNGRCMKIIIKKEND